MGIDIGSSGCKAIVVDENGIQRASSQREYEVTFSEKGGATLDSDEVMKRCFEVLRECCARVPADSVRSIGVSSQGEAFTAIGHDGGTLNRAMVSSDIRSETHVREWIGDFGEEKLYQITGHTPHPMFTLFKLLWFKKNQEDLWRRTRYFLCFEDLLQFRLGVKPAISWSLAGRTMMFDVRKHTWDKNILGKVGIGEEQLATPLPAGSSAGTIGKEAADMLGLSKDVFVVTGGHDQTCSALGAGVIEEGNAMLATGTVECICPTFEKPVFSRKLRENNLCTYDYSIKGLYTTVAFSLTGGNVLKWFRDQLGHQEVVEAQLTGKDPYELLLNGMESNPSTLLVLPYFTPSGTPYFDTRTKGAILGLQLSTQRKEILKALLEGVSFEMRLNLDILEGAGNVVRELRWVGGGSKSRVLAQIKSNVMNKQIALLGMREAGCFGAAMLACSADTGRPVRDLASGWVKQAATVSPQPEYEQVYRERFDAYKMLYHNVKAISF
jgi:xylulokinase